MRDPQRQIPSEPERSSAKRWFLGALGAVVLFLLLALLDSTHAFAAGGPSAAALDELHGTGAHVEDVRIGGASISSGPLHLRWTASIDVVQRATSAPVARIDLERRPFGAWTLAGLDRDPEASARRLDSQ